MPTEEVKVPYFETTPDIKLHEGAALSNICATGEVPNESINGEVYHNACPGTVNVVASVETKDAH